MDTMTYDALQPETSLALTTLVLALSVLLLAIVQVVRRGPPQDPDAALMRAAEAFAVRLEEAHRETRDLQRVAIDQLATKTADALKSASDRHDSGIEQVVAELRGISAASETRLKAVKALAEAVLPALAQQDEA